MRYIDKNRHRAAGLAITSEFLDRHCTSAAGRHEDIRYSRSDDGANPTFLLSDRKSFYKRMVNVLLDNQGYRCCYCLRKLKSAQNRDESDSFITIEHIIPRSFTSADDILSYRTAPGMDENNVVMTDEYVSPGFVQKKTAQPHKVAYANFVLSCNGTFPERETGEHNRSNICCNVARGNSEAYPVYFHPQCDEYVEYLKNGDIQAVSDTPVEQKVSDLINNVKLGCDSLKNIRRLWYALRNVEWHVISQCSNSEEKRYELLSSNLFDDPERVEEDQALIAQYTNPGNWETLLLYSVFHDIMRNKYC